MERGNNSIVARSMGYKHMLFYKKAVTIYDLTFLFCARYIDKRDRTYDQMVQAARSGKQNIVEGYVDGATSLEMCLKLLNVARGSLRELLEDYEDYIRTRNLRKWENGSDEERAMIRLDKENNDSDTYLKIAHTRNDEVIANMAIIIIKSAEKLLFRYIQNKGEYFKRNGGFRERLTRERLKERNGR